MSVGSGTRLRRLLLHRPERLEGKRALVRELIVVAALAALGGLALPYALGRTDLLIFEPMCGNGGLDSLGACVVGRALSLLSAIAGAAVAVGLLLRVLLVRRVILLSIAANLIAAGGVMAITSIARSLAFADKLGDSPVILGPFGIVSVYVIAYLFSELMLNVTRVPAIAAVVMALIVGVSGGQLLQSVGIRLSTRISEQHQQEELAELPFQLYAPPLLVGRFRFEGYSYNQFSDPPYVTLLFESSSPPTVRVRLFAVPPYFDPPEDCGPEFPLPEFWRRVITYRCPQVATSSEGVVLYRYSRYGVERPGLFFARLGDSVVSLEGLPPDVTFGEVAAIVDALEPATLSGLNERDAAARSVRGG